jgi:hydrogenase/urease accessory protein HupE
MVDSYLTNLSALGLPSYRQATSADLLVLPSRSIIGTAVGGNPAQINGVSVPLVDKWVLSSDEVAEVKAATDAYNVVIQAAATANNLAFVDAKAVMDQLSTTGLNFNTYNMTSTYVTGGSFSLDGVHPSARGYALITNLFVDAINAKYGSTLKKKDGRDFEILYPKVIN